MQGGAAHVAPRKIAPPLFVMRFAKGLGVDRKLFASKHDGTGSVPFSMRIPLEFKSKKKKKTKFKSRKINLIYSILYCF